VRLQLNDNERKGKDETRVVSSFQVNFMKRNYHFIISRIVLLFIVSLGVGFIFGMHGSKQSLNIKEFTMVDSYIAFMKILLRNSMAFLILFTGIFFGKAIIYFFFCLNGYILGLVVSKFNKLIDLITILPHGIFEIGSFMVTGYFLICFIQIKDKKYLKLAGLMYFGIVFSAVIESFITPALTLLVSNRL
jgi:uncharacterized membrane protein SpoIIM required for sporulation